MGLGAVVVKLMGWSTMMEVFDGDHARPVVETIGTRFGGIPSTLPALHLPAIDAARLLQLLPAALTIAFLAGIESLLSAVVAGVWRLASWGMSAAERVRWIEACLEPRVTTVDHADVYGDKPLRTTH